MAKASCDSCVYNVYDEDDETTTVKWIWMRMMRRD